MASLNLQYLYQRLLLVPDYYKQISRINYKPKNHNDLASGDFLDTCLRTVLKDYADVIHLNFSLVHNIFSPTARLADFGAYHFLEQITDIKIGAENREQILIRNPELSKPIVTIINTQGLEPQSEDPSADGGSHWVSLVILPKNFKGIFNRGTSQKSSKQRVYLFDSFGMFIDIPWPLKDALINGKSKRIVVNRKFMEFKLPHTIDKNSEFITRSNTLQQANDRDCGYWALYNALMIIFEGSDHFWQFFQTHKASRQGKDQAGLFLRTIFAEVIHNTNFHTNLLDQMKCKENSKSPKNKTGSKSQELITNLIPNKPPFFSFSQPPLQVQESLSLCTYDP